MARQSIVASALNFVLGFFSKGRIILIAIIVLGVVAAKYIKKEDSSKIVEFAQESFALGAERVKNGTVESYFTNNGTVDSDKSVDVVSEETGFVREILFKEGSSVKKGDVVVVLKKKSTIEMNAAKTAYQQKKAEVHTAEILAREGIYTSSQVRDAKIARDVAEQSYEETKSDNKEEILAPFDGLITAMYVKDGTYVFAGGGMAPPPPVFHMISVGKDITVTSSISGASMQDVGRSKSVEIITNRGKTTSGTIVKYNKSFNKQTGTIDITIRPKSSANLIFGDSVRVKFNVTIPDSYKIDYRAINIGKNGASYVKVLDENNTIMLKKVDVLFEDQEGNAIVSGLKNGDVVIVRGQSFVDKGEHIDPNILTFYKESPKANSDSEQASDNTSKDSDSKSNS